MLYSTQTITNTDSKYWCKILEIKKKRANFINPSKLYLKILLTSNESQGTGKEKCETYLDIEQQSYQNNLKDTSNTFIKSNNPYDLKIKAFEDDNYIYIYTQCSIRNYGNSVYINVLEEKGDIRRVKYFYMSKFELLPNITEIPIMIEGYSKSFLRSGLDGSIYAQLIAKFYLKKSSNYLEVKFKINSNNTVSPLYGTFDLFLSYNFSNKSMNNRFRVVEGTSNNVFLMQEDDEENNQYIFNLYSCIMGTGTIATFEIIESANLNTGNFIMFPNWSSNVELTTLSKDITPVRNNLIVGKINDTNCDIANAGELKYGQINFNGTTDMTIKFNEPFHTKCLNIQLTGVWKSDNSISYVISNITKEEFKVHLTGGNAITLYYLAIGY